MVSDSELIGRLREFLRTSDLNTTTTAIVRRKLEQDFGIDLSEKKAFIREQVDLFLQSQAEESEEEEDPEEDEEEKPRVKSEQSNGSESKGEGDEDEDEEEEEEEEEESSNGKSSAKRGSKKQDKEVKKRGGGFNKPCSLSPQLQKIVGVPEMARTEVVKQIWVRIRERNLQDPSNKRRILCDEDLRDLFRVDSIDMFQMSKALSKHIWPLESGDVKSTHREKPRKQKREESSEPKGKEKRQRGGNQGFLAPLPLSDALVKFLGTGESALSRSDVVKRMWDYIKQNNLQDPSDKRIVLCDEKLKELFEVESFQGFSVAKYLTAHFVKAEEQ